ncbi:MAG: class I SAM-dependent methyltransferase [Bacteroidetes bacterium]|nr:class I SAM-dependent methyltransferase [Bacteroidota bacterium]
MSFKITLIRKTKWLFYRFHLHVLIEPISGILLNLAYLSKASKWISKNRNVKFNDFYSPKWDYGKRYKLYEYVFKEKRLDQPITYLEFGVSGGDSFNWWLSANRNPLSVFAGFDTFEGLPEDWGGFKRGAMTANVPVTDDKRVTFYKGLFQETLPGFVKTIKPDQKKVIMMDADLFTSTLYVLTMIAPYLKKGDIILFDQFNVPMHEFLAFQEFTSSYYLKFELIGAANNYYFCAFELV